MWLLRHDGKGLIYRLTPGKNHIVSRKEGDLLLQDDQSISRKHAQLFVDDENVNEGVILKDLNAKYGTFTTISNGNQTRLEANQEVTLGSGDIVRFGIQWNSWRLEFVPLLVATSTLSQEEKAEVRQMVTELGGTLAKDWQVDCSHLTMNKITVTVKVVCALAAGQPIVTPAYWQSFTQALSTLQTTLPDCADYQPPLAEPMLNPAELSFSPNPSRASLFRGYTFVASTAKQLTRIKPMVTTAGGQVDQYSPSTWPESRLVDDKVVLMQHSMHEKTGSQQSQIPSGYVNIARKLKQHGLRTVPESEIGLSVLHCSLSRYCNPRHNAASVLGSSSSSLEPTQPVNVLCPNTEQSSSASQDASMDALTEPNVCLKRPLDEEKKDDHQPPNKKQNTRDHNSQDFFETQQSGNNTSKRRLSLSSGKSLENDCTNSRTELPHHSPKAGPSKAERSNVMPIQSLDMFSPSGSNRKSLQVEKVDEIRPSCQDMFASNESKKTQKERTDDDEDEFSFARTKRPRRPQQNEQCDEFSFKKQKVSKELPVSSNDRDEFSFVKDKGIEENNDEFSFTSNKLLRKRNRLTNSDLFAPSDNSSLDISCVAGTSKMADKSSEDNMFAFTSNHTTKRRRLNKGPESNEEQADIKIAMFSTGNGRDINSNKNNTESQPLYENGTEAKDLVTYSKKDPIPIKIKEEVEEEVDDLVKELQNATIVVVKSLVKPRKIVPQATETVGTTTNFKKFRKVTPLNKRAVPLIIGGNDLVPHNQMCDPAADDNLLPPDSPQQQQTPNDDWGFHRNRHKGRNH